MSDERTPVLTGPRVTLRPLRDEDEKLVLAMLAEPDVARWWGAYDAERYERDFRNPEVACFVIESAGAFAGVIMYEEVADPDYRSASVDITLDTAHQGLGLGTEALHTLIGYLFTERGHHRVTIDPAVANLRAIHVYRKVGFKPVGVMRDYERGPDGAYHDNLLMDLLATEIRVKR